ncbi:MAG: NAD(P)H-hydrate dehydratase [Oscillospiraceae bacterium]
MRPIPTKYDYGRVLIVGGCIAAIPARRRCAPGRPLRCGAGLVSVGVPEAIYAVTAVKNDEAMPFPLPSAEGKLARDALPVLLERLEKSDVCVLGPGLGRNDTLTALVQAVVMRSGTPLVLDADALFAVRAGRGGARARPRAHRAHAARWEFARLAGPDKTGRAEAASDFAVRHGCTVVRKGPETVCAFPDGDAAVLRVGNPGMAKGGSGDVLAGMLGALLCQMPARDAVQTAVWLHGRAGDLCAGRMGEYAMNPTDVIAALPGGHKTHHPIGGGYAAQSDRCTDDKPAAVVRVRTRRGRTDV